MKKRFHWLSGDSFFVGEKKKEIIQSLNKKNQWEVVNLPPIDSLDELLSEINEFDLFSNKKIIIYNEALPDFGKVQPDVLSKVPRNRIFILITPKIDRKTKLYKKLKDDLTYYEPLIQNGYVNKKNLTKVKNDLKKAVNWKGGRDAFDYIFEKCNYNPGIFNQELIKIRIYLERDEIKSLSEIKHLVSGTQSDEVDKFVDAICSRSIKRAYGIMSSKINSPNFSENYMMYLYALLDIFSFLMSCRLALDSKVKDPKLIGEFASEIFVKEKNGVITRSNSNTLQWRYKFNKDYVSRRTVEEYLSGIKLIRDSIEDIISQKYSIYYVFNRLILNIS